MEYSPYYTQNVLRIAESEVEWLVHSNPLSTAKLIDILTATNNATNTPITFASNKELQQLISRAKHLAGEDTSLFLKCRGRSNPYECLGKGSFINRSAMKLANIDAIVPLVFRHKSFVDLCGGPGGFTEYILKRHASTSSPCVGVGMSLKHPEPNSCNWNLWQLHLPPMISIHHENNSDTASSSCNFTLTDGADETGDILCRNNCVHLITIANNLIPPVSLVVADGGSLGGRDCDNQGAQGYALLMHQIAAAVGVLQTSGDALFKLFGLYEDCSQFAIGVLTHLFERVCVLKPITSRASSGEVYIICNRLRHVDNRDALMDACMRNATMTEFNAASLLTDDMFETLYGFCVSLQVHQMRGDVHDDLAEQLDAWLKDSAALDVSTANRHSAKRFCQRFRLSEMLDEISNRHYFFRNMKKSYYQMWKLRQMDHINSLINSGIE